MEAKRIPSNEMPEFGTTNWNGVRLEVKQRDVWEPFQLFFFDWMLDKEQNYWISNLDDLAGYEVIGKVRTGPNSDCIFWATREMLRIRPTV